MNGNGINDEFGSDDIIPAEGGVVAEVAVVEEERRNIIIDEVDGQPNYETVSVNGVTFQIMRGVETSVPVSVVEVLRNAIATKLVKVPRPGGGEDLVPRDLSSIPWRLVG